MRTALKWLGIAGVVLVAAAAWLAVLLAPPAPLEIPEQGFTLAGVTLVVPGSDGRRETRVDIRGEGGKIASVSPSSESGPFAGMTVLPGLTDAHVHFPPAAIPGQSELFAFLMLYHGITAVRDAADVDATATAPARDGVANGIFPGPRVFACGPFLDGDPPQWGNSIVINSPDDARAAVRKVAEGGFDCIKAYNKLEADELTAIHEEADRHGLPVIGHVPTRVPYEVARLDDAQHLIGVSLPPPGERLRFPFALRSWLDFDDGRLDFIIEQSLEHGIANTPTLITVDRLLASRDYGAVSKLPEARLLPRLYRGVIWHPVAGLSAARGVKADDFAMLAVAQERMLHTVKRMHEAGVELHTGTDTLVSWVVPGKALHRELRLLERAGISPDEVMKLSSVVSARALDTAGLGLGSFDVGSPAELVVFREDPTRDLAALDTIEAVVRDGRLFTREALDAQLARYQSHFDGVAYDALLTPLVRRVLAATLPNRGGDSTDAGQ